MKYQRFVLLVAMATVFMLLAACTTTSDDDDIAEAAADDTTAEVADDATDDAVVEEDDDGAADDAAAEEADDTTAEATDDATDDASEDDDPAVETVEDVENTLSDEQLEAFLSEVGFDSLTALEAPELNVETLEATTPGRTFDVVAYDNTYVGTVTDTLLVAISLDSSYAGDAEGISAYVCDGDLIGFYVSGELENGRATLDLAENAAIELIIEDDDTITGSVTLEGQELQSFETTAATGDAGLYVASDTVADQESVARWVVLEDGRAAGQWCLTLWGWQLCVSRNQNCDFCVEPGPPHLPGHLN